MIGSTERKWWRSTTIISIAFLCAFLLALPKAILAQDTDEDGISDSWENIFKTIVKFTLDKVFIMA